MYEFRVETSSEMHERLTAEHDAITIEIDEIVLKRDIAYALLTERDAALVNAAVAQFRTSVTSMSTSHTT